MAVRHENRPVGLDQQQPVRRGKVVPIEPELDVESRLASDLPLGTQPSPKPSKAKFIPTRSTDKNPSRRNHRALAHRFRTLS